MTKLLVVDASVIVDLLGRYEPLSIEELLFKSDVKLAAPELLDVEVLQALRRLDDKGAIPAGRAPGLLVLFRALRIQRYRHFALWDEVWRLRRNLTAYDAVYVALARQIDGTLVTRDRGLASAPGLGVRVAVPE